METSNNKSSYDETDTRELRSSSIDYNATTINNNQTLSRIDSTADHDITRHRNGSIPADIHDSDIISTIQFGQSGAANPSSTNFISSSANQQIYISQFPGGMQNSAYFFNSPNAHLTVNAPTNQQYTSSMALPSTHATGVTAIPEIDSIPQSTPLRQSEVRSILDESVMNMQHGIQDPNLIVSLNEQPTTYNYMNEGGFTVAPSLEAPSSTGMRFKKNNCSTWEYTLIDKKTCSIRIALQDGQVFFNLEDILEGVCGIEVTLNKIANITKTLLPWEEKVSAVQFGDTAFEKEEIFVTYEGLLKLKASRIASLHKARRHYSQTLNAFIQNLTKMMIQSFGRECILLEQSSSSISLPDETSSMDAIIRAWRYYRMLTDRLEAQFAKERINTSQLFQAPTNSNLEAPAKRARLDSTEITHPIPMQESLLPAHPSLLTENQHTPAVIDQQDVEQVETENHPLSLMLENQPGHMMGFQIRSQRPDQQTNFGNSMYESIIPDGNPVNEPFIDANPIMMEEQTLQQELSEEHTPENATDPIVWTSELISNVQSNLKKGKRCPICSNRCGNSSKVCSVCRTPFKHIEQNEMKRYKCSYEGCTMRFRFESQLLAHLRSHQNMKVFACNICKKLFATSSSLKCHLRIHNNEKPYQCSAEGCTKAFRTRTQLKQHMMQHTGELPFKCTFPGCNACFRTKRMLEPHLRSHSNEPSPHKCNVEGCGKVFAYRSGLLAHIKTVHDQKLPFHCHEKDCNMQFTSNAQLQEHYDRVHRNQQSHAILYDSSRLQPPMQAMQLPVLPIEISSGTQSQPMIMSSV